MKTFRQLFAQLPSYAEAAAVSQFHKLDGEDLDSAPSRPPEPGETEVAHAIACGIIWAGTKQGLHYWQELYSRAYAGEFDSPTTEKSVILFFHPTLKIEDAVALPGRLGYVRAVKFGGSIDAALDAAGNHLLPGESVSNTHSLIQDPEA